MAGKVKHIHELLRADLDVNENGHQNPFMRISEDSHRTEMPGKRFSSNIKKSKKRL